MEKLSKYTTLRVLKTKRNKIRRIAEKEGRMIENLADELITLGLQAREEIKIAERGNYEN